MSSKQNAIQHCSVMQAARHVRPPVSHPNSPAAAAAAPATDRLPGYSIGRTIGEGGFCKVRMGVHDMSGQQVAIKVIDKLKLKVCLGQTLAFPVFYGGRRGGGAWMDDWPYLPVGLNVSRS